ncbi:MAG: hypothetical protein ACRC6I_18215 [Paracoccaceae bacterium]
MITFSGKIKARGALSKEDTKIPRSGDTYLLPPGSLVTDGVDDILAAQHNDPLQDLALDNNNARPVSAGGTGSTTAPAARVALGLEIGVNVQAQNANLQAEAGLTGAADRVSYFTGLGAKALAVFTGFGRSLVAAVNAAGAMTTLGFSGFFQSLVGSPDAAALRATLQTSWTLVSTGSINAPVTVSGLGGYSRVLINLIDVAPPINASSGIRVGSVASGILTGSIYEGNFGTSAILSISSATTSARSGTICIERFNTTDGAKMLSSITGGQNFTLVRSANIFDRVRILSFDGTSELGFTSGFYSVYGAN